MSRCGACCFGLKAVSLDVRKVGGRGRITSMRIRLDAWNRRRGDGLNILPVQVEMEQIGFRALIV